MDRTYYVVSDRIELSNIHLAGISVVRQLMSKLRLLRRLHGIECFRPDIQRKELTDARDAAKLAIKLAGSARGRPDPLERRGCPELAVRRYQPSALSDTRVKSLDAFDDAFH